MSDHPFRRAGQVRRDLRPPDFCAVCGVPEAAHGDLAALEAAFPGWHILPAAFGGYRAEWKSPTGLSIRYVGGASVADLHRRLEVIEAARGDSE